MQICIDRHRYSGSGATSVRRISLARATGESVVWCNCSSSAVDTESAKEIAIT